MRITILGAGPAGLSAAYFAQKLGHQVTVIEKSDLVGGKGAVFRDTHKNEEFLLDFGPHAYHAKVKEINQLVHDHAGDDFFYTPVNQKLILNNKSMSYPFRIVEGLYKFNPFFSAQLLLSYLYSRIKASTIGLPENSFEEYGVKYFGRSLYELCFGHYTERVWGISAKDISGEFARRKLPKFSISGILKEWISGDSSASHAHLFGTQFGYHPLGMGSVYNEIARTIEKRGGVILRNQHINKMNFDNSGKLAGIDIESGSSKIIESDSIISTIPVTDLIKYLGDLGSSIEKFHDAFRFRDIFLFYIYLNRPYFSDAHWVYLVDNKFKFNRLSEQKNLTAKCCPDKKTVITLEISAVKGQDLTVLSEEEQISLALQDLKFFEINRSDIEQIKVKKLVDAYPVFINNLSDLKKSFFNLISTIPNLISTGRQGLFLDIDMHDAMYLGKLAAESINLSAPLDFYTTHESRLRSAKQVST